MRRWAALAILAVVAVLGAAGYVALDRYIYANGLNLNFKLIAIVVLLVLPVVLIVVVRRRKNSH